jgi:hypothetical protein
VNRRTLDRQEIGVENVDVLDVDALGHISSVLSGSSAAVGIRLGHT